MRTLAALLREIEQYDQDYEVRYRLVLKALWQAVWMGLSAGIRIDPEQPHWPVVYIELPHGQVSWHLPAHSLPWDGHTTAEKYARTRAFIAQVGLPVSDFEKEDTNVR